MPVGNNIVADTKPLDDIADVGRPSIAVDPAGSHTMPLTVNGQNMRRCISYTVRPDNGRNGDRNRCEDRNDVFNAHWTTRN